MDFRKVILWTITIFLGLVFIMSGVSKIGSPAEWQARFTGEWGLPAWLVPLVGLAEIAGGVLLMMPKRAVWGGGVLVVLMIGAAGTHVGAAEYSRLGTPVAFALLAALIAYARRPRPVHDERA